MVTSFFKIDGRPIIPSSWGDYGHILQHGMSSHRSRVSGRLALERTGPFIPPITLPGIGDVVLTSGGRQLLESSGLLGFSFAPVEKVHIVELHWENWNLDTDLPPEIPESREPEDYILAKPHSPRTSDELGDLWELVVPATVSILRPKPIVSSYRELQIDLSTWNGTDLIRGSGYGSVLFSERASEWVSERWGLYVSFDQFRAV